MMKNRTIVMALLGSAFVLGTGLTTTRSGNARTSNPITSDTFLSGNLLSGSRENQKGLSPAGISLDFILSTVSADFALPGRTMAT
jgi:hypothetical protein